MAEIDMISGIILSGGKSSRFGSNKAFIRLDNGFFLIDTITAKLKGLFTENLIVVKGGEEYHFLNDKKVNVVEDIFLDFHPLGGIYTGLTNISNEYAFICGCDMPFINRELIQDMTASCDKGFDAVIPQYRNRLQPLCGIYSKRCIKPIKTMIEKGELKIMELFNRVNINILNEDRIALYDPEGRSFFDIDTVEDLKLAVSIQRSAKKTES